jgi:succinate dehydrogenase/fumarate reductase flavoprotein subunit
MSAQSADPLIGPDAPVAVLAEELAWDTTADVIVVGGGVAGMSTAINSADLGASVLVLDKGCECGGTTRKAAAGMMVPNNGYMSALGQADPKDDFIRFLARVGRPLLYDEKHPQFGLPRWEYDLIETYYDNAAAAFDRLDEIGALRTIHQPDWSSYNEVAEDKARFGRVLFTLRPDGEVGDGKEFMRQMLEAAERAGVRVRTRHRVTSLLVSAAREVVGVRVRTPDATLAVRAHKAVVFACGGFTHNEELRREYLNGMYVGGCAALTSEGDFIPIAKALGVPLVHMHACWGAPVLLEQALERDPELIANFVVPGDSILVVNKYGARVGNEKATYNDRTQAHFVWDPARAEYPNFLLFALWDERNARLFKANPDAIASGNFIPPAGERSNYVMRGSTLDQLATGVDSRLAALKDSIGGVRLSEEFTKRLVETIARFNEFARAGRDEDFHRGQTAIEFLMHGEPAPDNRGNPTMFPLSDQGPYYGTILAPGSIETKGGPKVNNRLQVLDGRDRPVPGLYGVGNCVASPSGQAYWSGGSTFGPYVTFGRVAAQAIAQEPAKDIGVEPAVSAGGANWGRVPTEATT